jgi:hypothetical protein
MTWILPPLAQSVRVTKDKLRVNLVDGRAISVPIAWYPRLLHAAPKERQEWQLIGEGKGIHWESLDEDISVEGLLGRRLSGESQFSFKRWLDSRKSRRTRSKRGNNSRL